jgi:NAD/NADP transhydrogenase beta subunit
MISFEDWSAPFAFITIIAALTIGYCIGRLDSKPTTRSSVDPLLACTHAELRGLAIGLVAALVVIHNKTGPPSSSPPVSGAGLPVAGAGGETG